MRIAIYSEVFTPDKNGVATHTKTLKAGLERAGHDVLVVTADKRIRHHLIDESNVLRCPAVRLKRAYGFGLGMLVSPRRLKLVRAFAPDIIHIQSEFAIGLSGVFAARKLALPLVYTVHTMYDDTYVRYIIPGPFAGAAKKLLFRYINFLTRCTNAVIVPSNRARQFLLDDIHAEESKFNQISNAIDWSAFDPGQFSEETRMALRHRIGVLPTKRTAVYLGRLGKEKSLDVLLGWWAEAMRPEDNWQLVIVGDGPEAGLLREQVEASGITSMVIFTGAVENTEVRKYLAIGDVFMTASLSENNSISMLEAMASGLMVLQRYDPGTADQIQIGVNGEFFENSAQMAAKLRRISALDETELAEEKKRVRASVRCLDTQTMVNKTQSVYEREVLPHRQETEPEMAGSSPR